MNKNVELNLKINCFFQNLFYIVKKDKDKNKFYKHCFYTEKFFNFKNIKLNLFINWEKCFNKRVFLLFLNFYILSNKQST